MLKLIVSLTVFGIVAGYLDEKLQIADRIDRIDLKKEKVNQLRAAARNQ